MCYIIRSLCLDLHCVIIVDGMNTGEIKWWDFRAKIFEIAV